MNKKEFWDQINDHWKDIKNNDALLTYPAKELFDHQYTLINNVIDIHKKERQSTFYPSHIHVKELKINGTASYENIYFMDESCDYYFVGDLHSDAFILEHLLDTLSFFEKVENNHPFKIIFLGDYVDRGNNHLKTLHILFMLKNYFPENIYLLMGNHDIGHIENGDVTLYLKKVEDDMDYFYIYLNHLHKHHPDFTDALLESYLTLMNTLHVTAFIQTKYGTLQGVHGGIPRPQNNRFDYITSFEQLTNETLDHESFRIRDCLLWSDPSKDTINETKSGKRFKFDEHQLDAYFQHFGIDLMVRGHQAVENGHLELFSKIHTIFSSGRVHHGEENINTDTAYEHIPPKVLKLDIKKGLPLEVLNIKLGHK